MALAKEDQEVAAESRFPTQCNPHSQEQLCKGPCCWHNHPLSSVRVTGRHSNLGGKCFHLDLLPPFKALRSPQKRAQKVSVKEAAVQRFALWPSALLDLQRYQLQPFLRNVEANGKQEQHQPAHRGTQVGREHPRLCACCKASVRRREVGESRVNQLRLIIKQ